MKKQMKYGLIIVLLLFLSACSGNNNEKKSSQKEETEKQETVIYVTRHGETLFNQMKKVQGWSDTPLTSSGEEIAEKLGDGLQKKNIVFKKVYTSDSGRARETAQKILEAYPNPPEMVEDKQLRELFFGSFEGDLDEEMWGKAAKTLGYPDEAALKEHLSELGLEKVTAAMAENDQTGQFETYDHVRKRMQAELIKIAKATEKDGGGNVLVVSHGMAITALLSDWTDEETDRPLPNAGISKLHYQNGRFTVESVGDTSFIE